LLKCAMVSCARESTVACSILHGMYYDRLIFPQTSSHPTRRVLLIPNTQCPVDHPV
ncbi:hypothetical protein AVEN_255774-1, partial [Araneus ventricosus]